MILSQKKINQIYDIQLCQIFFYEILNKLLTVKIFYNNKNIKKLKKNN